MNIVLKVIALIVSIVIAFASVPAIIIGGAHYAITLVICIGVAYMEAQDILKKKSEKMITLDFYDIKNLCSEMAEVGAANYIKQTKPSIDLISQREAYKLFQEGRVKRWIQAGTVSCIRGGSSVNSKKLYSMAELLSADKSERINAIFRREARDTNSIKASNFD